MTYWRREEGKKALNLVTYSALSSLSKSYTFPRHLSSKNLLFNPGRYKMDGRTWKQKQRILSQSKLSKLIFIYRKKLTRVLISPILRGGQHLFLHNHFSWIEQWNERIVITKWDRSFWRNKTTNAVRSVRELQAWLHWAMMGEKRESMKRQDALNCWTRCIKMTALCLHAYKVCSFSLSLSLSPSPKNDGKRKKRCKLKEKPNK